MLAKSDEEILNDRLQNWGRWAADRPHAGQNVLWRFMKLYGEAPAEEEPQEHPPVLDEFDAVFVNRAWQGLPESPLRYKTAKWILAAHYCYPNLHTRWVCKQLHVGRKDYETLLTLAKYLIFNRLTNEASKRLASD